MSRENVEDDDQSSPDAWHSHLRDHSGQLRTMVESGQRGSCVPSVGPAQGSGFAPILAGPKLTGEHFQYQWQVHVYEQAAKIGNVIYQLPCNCRCDRALGHTSLRSCYEGYHGTECSTCAQEAFYAYAMTKAGKTPAEIRAGIAQHAYEQIDLEKQ